MRQHSTSHRLTLQGLTPIRDDHYQAIEQYLHQSTTQVQPNLSEQDNAHWYLSNDHCLASITTPPPTPERHTFLTNYCAAQQLDYAWLPKEVSQSDFRLLVMDMDATLITIECLDEIADFAGCKAEVAAITHAAMTDSTIDFSQSLQRRVALLQNADADILEQVYQERLQLSPGATHLLAHAQQHGIKTLLVSGGFTFFTEKLKARLNLDFAYANTLEVQDGKLTGRIQNKIIDAQQKANIVEATCTTLGITPRQAIVMGDGANDLKMMAIAGLSVAFRAKPIVRTQANLALNFVGLDGVFNILNNATRTD
ncbi:MAG: phosphoserine phosphatase SerB [Ottowia sp.]|nr:phosphoserine phosphatase SerB [Ottowia sp.]